MENKSIKARVVAVCSSAEKGTRKIPQNSARILKDCGLAGDAHAEIGTKRQASLLAVESIEEMKGLSSGNSMYSGGYNGKTQGIF
ncbi:MAG TPA: hypothetical protein ENN05_08775 [Deltaproteobacteria bacterium]|nr:hypothetical protein [Deltaproteobacteria bacterium]